MTEAVLACQLEPGAGDELQAVVSGKSFSTIPEDRMEIIKCECVAWCACVGGGGVKKGEGVL